MKKIHFLVASFFALTSILIFTSTTVYSQDVKADTASSTEPLISLTEAELKEMISPSVVRLIQHVEGDVEIVPFELDLINLKIVEVDKNVDWQIEPVDKYIIGNGAVISPTGYVLVNAHLVSSQSIRLALASPIAEALFTNALNKLTSEELDILDSKDISPEESSKFSTQIINYIIKNSKFPLASSINIITPEQAGQDFLTLSKTGISSVSAYVNNNFYVDKVDFALINSAIKEPKPLPITELGETEEVFALQYPLVVDTNTSELYNDTLIKGIVRADLTDETYPDIYYIEMDSAIDSKAGLGPLYNDSGQVVGLLIRPESNTTSSDLIYSALHLGVVINKLEALKIDGFGDSSYRNAMLEYFQLLRDGDIDAASNLLTQNGISQIDTLPPVEQIVEEEEIVSAVEEASSMGLWAKIMAILKKPMATFSVTVEDATEQNPLNMIILVGASILGLVLLIIIIWVVVKLKKNKVQVTEKSKQMPDANTFSSTEFSRQTQKTSESQQKFLQQGVRTMYADTPQPDIPVPVSKSDNTTTPQSVETAPPTLTPASSSKPQLNIGETQTSDTIADILKAESATSGEATKQGEQPVTITADKIDINMNVNEDDVKLAELWPEKYAKETSAIPESGDSSNNEGTKKIYTEIVNYIRDTKNKGFNTNEISDSLLKAGWRNVDIKNSFDVLMKTE